MGAAGATVAGPLIYQTLIDNGIDPETAGWVTTGLVTAGGVALGGASGGAAAFNESTNNFWTTLPQLCQASPICRNMVNAVPTLIRVVTTLGSSAGSGNGSNTDAENPSGVNQIPTPRDGEPGQTNATGASATNNASMVATPPVAPLPGTPAGAPNLGPSNTGNTNPVPPASPGTPPLVAPPPPTIDDSTLVTPIDAAGGNNGAGGGFGAGPQPVVNPVVMSSGSEPSSGSGVGSSPIEGSGGGTSGVIQSIERDGNVYQIVVVGSNGTVTVVTEMTQNGNQLILTGTHIEGSGAGTSSLSELREFARAIGKQYGVDEVVIQGGTRTSGANPGRAPRPIIIKVNP